MRLTLPTARLALAVLLAPFVVGGCDLDGGPLSSSPEEREPTTGRLLTVANSIPDRYVVVFRPGTVGVSSVAAQMVAAHGGRLHFSYEHALQGFAATLSPAAVEAIRRNPRVAYIAQDGMVRISVEQPNATWGLDRIDQRDLPLNTIYSYGPTGTGVRVYVLDTGILTTHDEFGGRASVGMDAIGDGWNGQDCHGHGTHVAGTVGGTLHGVAKSAQLVSVRVLDCAGSGTWAGVIAGIDWVTASAQKPAVANMSLGGGFYQPANDAVAASIASGIPYVLSAGNENVDACTRSPASTPAATTVGSTTSMDARSWFSNWGGCVDLFAPGSDITSAWRTSNTAIHTISGTSMAAPHVAGVAALHLETNPLDLPSAVDAAIRAGATVDRLSSIGTGSPNLLLFSLLPPPPVATAPAAPSNVSATAVSGTRIDVRWTDMSDNEDNFRIDQRILQADGTWGAWALVSTRPANTTVLAHTGLTSGATYQFRVRACNAAGCSATVASSRTTTPVRPAVPSNVTGTPTSGTRIEVSWTDESGNETRFDVDRRLLNPDGTWGEWAPVATRPANSTTFTDSGLTSGASYQYRVRACNLAGCSAISASTRITTPVRPAAPSNVAAVAVTSTRIDVSWTDQSNNEMSFRVGRRIRNPDSTWGEWSIVAIQAANVTTFVNTALTPATPYQYRVQACNAAGCSTTTASTATNTPAS